LIRFPANAARSTRAATAAGIGAAVVGGVGFAAGFFGPIALNPEANQGPLVGILITGPGGALLGAVLGGLLGALGVEGSAIFRSLIAASVLLGVGTLFAALPEPQFRGNVLELSVTRCDPPGALKAEAFADWDERIAAARWASESVRPGWKQGFEAMVAADPGVVIGVAVTRSVGLYENRKPWNAGTYRAGKAWWVHERYFARGSSCADWTPGKSGVYLAAGDPRSSKAWPAEVLPNFLNLQLLGPATQVQQAMLEHPPGP
jgi:MFS family permease